MKTEKSGLMGAGLLSAVAASLCCITPILALVTGASGVASTFSWMEPFRPVLIALTLAVLAFAWYRKLKPKPINAVDCVCEDEKKPPFLQSKKFLGIVTLFAVAMLAFPYYGHVFYPSKEVPQVSTSTNIVPKNFQQVSFKVRGMTCQSCGEHIEHSVNQLPGINHVNADFKEGTTAVQFDPAKTNKEQLVQAINSTGYKVQTEIK